MSGQVTVEAFLNGLDKAERDGGRVVGLPDGFRDHLRTLPADKKVNLKALEAGGLKVVHGSPRTQEEPNPPGMWGEYGNAYLRGGRNLLKAGLTAGAMPDIIGEHAGHVAEQFNAPENENAGFFTRAKRALGSAAFDFESDAMKGVDHAVEVLSPEANTRRKYPTDGSATDIALSAVELGTEMMGGGAALGRMAGTKAAQAGLNSGAMGTTGYVGAKASGAPEDVAQITGALFSLSSDPRGLAKLSAEKVERMFSILFRGGRPTATLETATTEEKREALQYILRNMVDDRPDYVNASPEEQAALVAKYADEFTEKARNAVADGEVGTLGQLTRDKGVLSEESKIASAAATGKHDANVALERINNRIQSDVHDTLEGIPRVETPDAALSAAQESVQNRTTRATDIARQRQQARTGAANAALDEAIEGVGEAFKPFKAAGSTADAGTAFKKSATTLRAKSIEEVDRLYDATLRDASGADRVIPASTVKKAVNDWLSGMHPSQEKLVRDELSVELDRIYDVADGDRVNMEAFSALVSKASKASDTKTGGAAHYAHDLKQALLDGVDQRSGNRLDKARTAAEKHHRSFDFMKRLDDAEAAFGAKAIPRGDAGGDAAAHILDVGDGKTVGAAKDVIRARMGASMLRGGDPSEITSSRVRTAETSNDASLGEFADVSRETSTLARQVEKREAATEAVKQAAKKNKVTDGVLTRYVKAVNASATGEFAKAEGVRVGDSAGRAISGLTPVSNLKRIMKDIGPENHDSLRGAFMRDFIDNQNKSNKLSNMDSTDAAGGMRKFNELAGIYKDAGLFDDEQINMMKEAVIAGQKLKLHNSKKFASYKPEEQRILTAIAAVAGAKAGAAVMGSPLIGAALGRRFVVKGLEDMTTTQIESLGHEMMLNPKSFIDVVDELDPSKSDEIVDVIRQRYEELLKARNAGTVYTHDSSDTEGKTQ